MSGVNGIGASLVTVLPNTVIRAEDLASNFSALNSSGVSNDGQAIQTDGSGNIYNFGGKLQVGGVTVLDASGFDLYLHPRGSTNLVHIDNTLALEIGNVSAPSVIKVGAALGVEKSDGTHLFEAKSTGDFVIGGAYKTVGSTTSIAASSSMDSYDLAELYPADFPYSPGTIVCIGDNDLLTQCTHDACPCAMIVSDKPGMCLGDSDAHASEADGILQIALCGRVVVNTSDGITPRTFVCSNGQGGVRATTCDEKSVALGFALNRSQDGKVGIFIRK